MGGKIRFGLVGYGCSSPHNRGGRGKGLFTHSVEAFDDVLPAAICDKNAQSREWAAEAFPEVPIYEDFDEMLETTPLDALLIETPATHHAEFASKALRRNIHVLSDIPTVATAEEAQELWEAHLESKAMYMTGANANYKAFFESAIDLKRRGLLGEPYYVECSYIHDLRGLWESSPWRKTYESIRYCTHSLGPVLRLVEEDIVSVSCFDTGSHINREEGQHDAMAALFRTGSNVVIRLLTSFVNNYPSGGHHYRFFTTKGAFERTAAYPTMLKAPAEQARTLFYSTELYGHKRWTELPVDRIPIESASDPVAKAFGHGGIDFAMMNAFFQAIREGAPSPIPLREGLRMTLPGIYAADSARAGGELRQIRYPWS